MAVATTMAAVQARPIKGILLVVLATLAFALADVVTKQQAMRHPVVIALSRLELG